jgi:N-acetylglucosaminyldiphosphoundecaprenol N-acetyl-beta-D-mannosaminyltransferase
LKEIFGLNFFSVTLAEAADLVIDSAKRKKKGLVVTPNVDHIVQLQNDNEMRQIYTSADFVFADGMPIVWLSKVLRNRALPERVTGADLLPAVCERSAKQGLQLMFVGGLPGVAAQAALKLQEQYPGLKVVSTYSPPFGFENDIAESNNIITLVRNAAPDILFIGVGTPKQEKWAHAHIHQLQTGPILCVGAAFDFAAGNIKRAPILIQKLGLEWAWRLASEPKRLWRRYIVTDSRFIYIAAHEISKHYLVNRQAKDQNCDN